MPPHITFVIPVRHQDTVSDWDGVCSRLSDTISSIESQTNDNWQAIIIANNGAKLPETGHKFSIVRVDMPANTVKPDPKNMEPFYEAVRSDKGHRILTGLLSQPISGHVMVVDYDDYVNRHLVEFVSAHADEPGWYFDCGYFHDGNDFLIYRQPRLFSHICGTSHIIRYDLFKLPSKLSEASEAYVRRMLGSHKFIEKDLASSGTPLKPLPFEGAVYRIGYRGATSGSGSILKEIYPRWICKPWKIVIRLFRLRHLNKTIRDDFFGRISFKVKKS